MKQKLYFAILAVLSVFNACTEDLNTVPIDQKTITSANVFNDPNAYIKFLAKLYGGLNLTGQIGEYGDPEISANDEGTTSFLRTFWSIQEVTTDEAINAWNDPGLDEFNGHVWSDQNLYNKLLYQRVFINISFCNEYVREVNKRVDGLESELREDVINYLAEARFLRAFYYWVALDTWGNVPFVTEANAPGSFLPKQINRADLFNYIEGELTDIMDDLLPANQNPEYYPRANKAAAWALLAKLYLNAEVYLGQGNAYYNECIQMCDNIIGSGYTISDKYENLFLADNHNELNEIIFAVAEDGQNSRNYGGLTYVIHSQLSEDMDPASFGVAAGAWAGNRFTSSFVNHFADISGNTDKRAMFYTDGHSKEIDNPGNFYEGYASIKFKNVTSRGAIGAHDMFVDTDFPLYRLADIYLMYAEAVLRGGNGNINTALTYVNDLRQRAYGNTSGDITTTGLTLDFILDERTRELHWEAHRRTDLIRYGKFTGSAYIWDRKGDVKEGIATPEYRNLFPIPASDLGLNTNLKQNEGY